MEYQEVLENLEKEAQLLRNHQWKYSTKKNGMMVYYAPSANYSGNMYKFTYEVDLPMEALYQVLKPPLTAQELKWDKSVKKYEVIKRISDESFIGMLTTHDIMMGMISSREFLDINYFKTYEKDALHPEYGRVSWCYAKSVELPERPTSSNVVRGKDYSAGFAVAENKKDPSKSYLEIYYDTDGWHAIQGPVGNRPSLRAIQLYRGRLQGSKKKDERKVNC